MQRIIVDFLIVKQAVTPVRLFPAPQGSTIIPDLVIDENQIWFVDKIRNVYGVFFLKWKMKNEKWKMKNLIN